MSHLSPEDARRTRDEKRMAALRDGSVESLEALMADYWTPLSRWAARLLDDADTAKDVVQETFIQVWQRRRQWSATGSPRAYLFRITRSLVIDEFRRRKVRRRWLLANRTAKERTLSATPANEFEAAEIWRAYERAIEALPERRREVFLLVHVNRLTHAEAADVLQISPQTVANQMASALRQLRNALGHLV